MNHLKVEFNKKTYKLIPPTTFTALISLLTQKLGKNPLDTFEIVYNDSESDQILVHNEDDYQIALLSTPPNTLKFLLRNSPELDTNNPEIFRLSNLCEYLSKIEEQMENSYSTKKNEQANRKTDSDSPNTINPSTLNEPSDTLNRSFIKKNDLLKIEEYFASEAVCIDFINLFVLLKIKEVVVEPFRSLCSLAPNSLFKNDQNTTKSTNAVNSINLTSNKILSDTFLQNPHDVSLSKSLIQPKRSDQLSKITVSRFIRTRGRRSCQVSTSLNQQRC